MNHTKRTLIEITIFLIIAFAGTWLLIPRFALLLNNKGVTLSNQGNIEKAIFYYKKSLRLKQDAEVRSNLAAAYHAAGLANEAINEYKKILLADPSYGQTYLDLASLLKEQNRYLDALFYLEKAMPYSAYRAQEAKEELLTEYAVSLYNNATIAYSNGKLIEARGLCEKIIEQIPAFALGHKLIGDICLKQDTIEEAITHYKKALRLGLNDAALLNNIGILYMRLEEYAKAAYYLEKAYVLSPQNKNILYNLASTLRDYKNYDGALEKYIVLSKLDFEYPNLHNEIATIHLLRNDKKKAKDEFIIERNNATKRLRAKELFPRTKFIDTDIAAIHKKRKSALQGGK